MKKFIALVLMCTMLSGQAHADSTGALLGVGIGGLLLGTIITQNNTRTYVQTMPVYPQQYAPPPYYVPPPYYPQPRVCDYYNWYDSWGYLHQERHCY